MTIVACILLQGISAFVCTQVTNVYLFLFIRVLMAIGGAGSFGTLLVFVTEITSMKYRSRPTMATQLAFSCALLFISLIAYFIRDWKMLIIIISGPSIPLALLTMWLAPESPRWLMSVKREKQAGKILNKMAEINKTNFRYEPEYEIELSNSNDRNVKIWKIFTVRDLLKRTLIMMFAWVTVIFVYYGLTLNLGVLAGNVYLNLFLNSLFEISVILFAVFFVDRFGRRKLTLSFMVASGITGILTLFPYLYASKDQYWIITALTTFSRMCIAGAISVICLYTCELYPTCIRNSSVGILAGFARFGGVLSPYIMNLSTLAPGRVGKSLPLMLMGITCFVSGILLIFLPETTNKPMQDTLDEVTNNKHTNNSACKEGEMDETVELNAVA
ncbi:unnamed protein product [Acanthosepion pharaonis]|uniref:Major facilitator superfamily (MFS) profile domain-containing protein n=1 Tax=Acanthosepion pharaonis TaxID=158019 RepID=A0A812AL45_ACAPH|nr:unnamed protein product [Sepia pharaonis]